MMDYFFDIEDFISGSGLPEFLEPGNKNTTVTDQYDEIHFNYDIIVIQLVVCGIGLIGNIAAIAIIFFTKEFRKATVSWFVLQLAIANALFLITLPFRAAERLQGAWNFSGGMCKAKETIMFLNYYASIIFITIMSVDQYMTLRSGHTNMRAKRRSWLVAYVTTAITWILCLVMCIPVILYSDKIRGVSACFCITDFPRSAEEVCPIEAITGEFTPAEMDACLKFAQFTENSKKCVEEADTGDSDTTSFYDFDLNDTAFDAFLLKDFQYDEETDDLSVQDSPGCNYHNAGQPFKIFLYFNFVVMFLIPLLIMVVVYGLIIHLIRQKPEAEPAKPGTSAEVAVLPDAFVRERKRMRITIMCVVFVAIFVICWLPFHAAHMAKMAGISSKESTFCLDLSMGTATLAYMHAAINPYLYIFARGTRKIKRALRSNKNKVFQAASQFTKTLALNSSSATLTDSSGNKRQKEAGVQLQIPGEASGADVTTSTPKRDEGEHEAVDTTIV